VLGHVDQFWIGCFFQDNDYWFECHVVDRAVIGCVVYDIRMYGIGVLCFGCL